MVKRGGEEASPIISRLAVFLVAISRNESGSLDVESRGNQLNKLKPMLI